MLQSQTRLPILEKLTQHLNAWDGTSEAANKIIEQNKSLLTELKKVDAKLGEYSQDEQQQVSGIIEAQQKLLTVIKTERKNLLDKMKQVNKKDKVVKNYYSSFQQSIFVDKGV